MGAGHYATVADRMHDRFLRPCWGMPQPEKAKPTLAATGWASKNPRIHNAPMYIKALAGTQLPICAALRRTGQLEYRAGLLAEVEQRDAALRLAELAGGRRAVLA